MPYETSVAFDSIAVIESLRPGEFRSGRDLFETTIAPASIADAGLLSELYEPKSSREFLNTLRTIAKNAKEFGRSPLLHIEVHGSRDGIQLADDSFATWSEIAPILTTVNTVSRMNLLVVAAMCEGWHLSSVLRPTDRSPAFGVIGTEELIAGDELLRIMQAFYSSLLIRGHNLRAALDAANAPRDYPDWPFRMEGAELILCKVFQHYVQEIAREETQTERVSRLVADIARARNLDVLATMRLRQELRLAIDDHARWFYRYRDEFLMLDLFPENARRFPLKYEDCGVPKR